MIVGWKGWLAIVGVAIIAPPPLSIILWANVLTGAVLGFVEWYATRGSPS